MSDLDGTNITPAHCLPSRPCNRWRSCSRCARRRQAHIATAVENLHSETGQLRWHILYPTERGAAALREARADWLRAAQPIGAVWTIEQSRKTGALHCNIITPASTDHHPTNAKHWQQIIKGNPRAVGAYIAKPSQFPTDEAYAGRLFGTSGQLWQILTSQRQAPAVAAAAAQFAINSHTMIDRAAFLSLHPGEQNNRLWLANIEKHRKQTEPTRSDFRKIAEKWLPDLLEWKENHREKTSLELAKEFCQREGT